MLRHENTHVFDFQNFIPSLLISNLNKKNQQSIGNTSQKLPHFI